MIEIEAPLKHVAVSSHFFPKMCDITATYTRILKKAETAISFLVITIYIEIMKDTIMSVQAHPVYSEYKTNESETKSAFAKLA